MVVCSRRLCGGQRLIRNNTHNLEPIEFGFTPERAVRARTPVPKSQFVLRSGPYPTPFTTCSVSQGLTAMDIEPCLGKLPKVDFVLLLVADCYCPKSGCTLVSNRAGSRYAESTLVSDKGVIYISGQFYISLFEAQWNNEVQEVRSSLSVPEYKSAGCPLHSYRYRSVSIAFTLEFSFNFQFLTYRVVFCVEFHS